jgi:hypothetical protein
MLVDLVKMPLPTIKTNLAHLREANLITIQHSSYPASPIVYQLIPPDEKEKDYAAFISAHKSDVISNEGDAPVIATPETIALPVMNIIPTENLWLDEELKDFSLDRRTKPISQWTVTDFMAILRFLFFREYKVEPPEFDIANSKMMGMLKSGFLQRFHKQGETNEDCIRYILWLFQQVKEVWLRSPIGMGLVVSLKMQQRWKVMRKQEQKEEKKTHHITKEKVRTTCKEVFFKDKITCLTCARYDECSAAASMKEE